MHNTGFAKGDGPHPRWGRAPGRAILLPTVRAPCPRWWPALALGGAGLLASQPASASNCAVVSALVEFREVPCVQVIDRSVDPVLHLTFGYEQTSYDAKPPESVQSVHVFAVTERMAQAPPWLSEQQVADAVALFTGSDCEPVMVQDAEILEKNQELAGTWFRLNETPIPVAGPEETVDLDLASLPVGTYMLYAYTQSERFSAWAILQGVIKVVDGPEPADFGPSLFIRDPVLGPFPGQEYDVIACVDGMSGLELDVEWTLSSPGAEEDWTPVAACLPVETGEIPLPFILPQEVADLQVRFRGKVVDPTGREHHAITNHRVVGKGTQTCIDDFIKPDWCADWVQGDPDSLPDNVLCEGTGGETDGAMTDGGSSSTGSDTTGSSGTTGNMNGGGGDCACRGGASSPGFMGLSVLAWGFVRRRRG